MPAGALSTCVEPGKYAGGHGPPYNGYELFHKKLLLFFARFLCGSAPLRAIF
ncbi:MAG TPA: hypothetical protein VNX47_14235 [Nevskia sp.]|nr:hypothetical protein [Nevskia sp.]